MADSILVDGEWQDHLPADDRGLAYGDGVFRTLRVVSGEPLAWDVHLQRLAHDCERLFLPVPSRVVLADDVGLLFPNNDDGVLKIMVTRGSGARGYMPSGANSRRILSAHPLPESIPVDHTLALDRSPVVLAQQPRLAGVKHLNRLEQVLARDECRHDGVEDAFMCDAQGRIICTTMRNLLFIDNKGEWLTPALTRAGIIGATRQQVTSALSAAGQSVHEIDIDLARVDKYGGAIACNSVGGVLPVSRIGSRAFTDSEKACEYVRNLMSK